MREDYNSNTHSLIDEGINHLTTDNSILNVLLEAQEHDDLLQAFSIKFVDSKFAQNPNGREKNTIYIVRRNSTLISRMNDSQSFNATIEVYIALREYNSITAQRILKTMYKDIMYHLANSEIIDYLEVKSFRFEYVEPGILDLGVITFTAIEVENFCFEYDPEPIRIALGIRTSIEGTNERRIKFKGKELRYGK